MISKDGVNIVSIKVLNDIQNKNVLIVDIRDRESYLRGHIPGAVYKTEMDLYKQRELLKNYDKVYIYCQYGNKGMYITQYLQEKYALSNVYNIVGGYNVYRGKIEK